MMDQVLRRLGKTGAGVLAALLWLATAALGLFEIWLVREMVLRVYARFESGGPAYGEAYWGGLAVGNWLVLVLGVVWIALVIGGGEYHAKHFGQRRSWRLFSRTLAVQLAILVLALFI
jgi:hypothetical protein